MRVIKERESNTDKYVKQYTDMNHITTDEVRGV